MKKALRDIILWINAQGWSPATSTNYSARMPDHDTGIYLSRSGVDKSQFTENDLIEMSIYGDLLPGFQDATPSAETDIHLCLYQHTNAAAILHTHSIADTLLSRLYASDGRITLRNYEVLKGIHGISTHETEVVVPIFPNTQDIATLSRDLKAYIEQHPSPFYGFLIESHGFYTWGSSLQEAKRHLEVFQFLFSCEMELRKIQA